MDQHSLGRIAALSLALQLTVSSTFAGEHGGVAVSAENAWARATPPGARTGAVYFTLNNAGEADALIGAQTPVAERAELHTHKHEDGMMRMEQVEKIALPSDGKAVLEPHGDHLMLIGLSESLVTGESLSVTLEFQSGRSLELEIPVKDGRQR